MSAPFRMASGNQRLFKMTSTLSEAYAFHPPGLASRWAAANLLEAVLRRNRPLDEQLDDRHPNPSLRGIDERDRALARRIVATVLRRLGTLRRLTGDILERGLPKDGALVEGALLIGAAHRPEPPLDVTVKSDPDRWAQRLGGRELPTGSVRMAAHGQITALAGYAEGEWWVQDAAAALPARLFGDLRGRTVADLCAAPGGKTAQLAACGARVTALDRSASRMERLKENLSRAGLDAVTVVADAEHWKPDPPTATFDAVLIDAPCTSTGTIRRHPDIPWRKTPDDIAVLSALQRRLLVRAIDLTRPGGTIVYSTCSLEPEEGEDIVSAVVDQDRRVRCKPITASEFRVLEEFITSRGELRTLPCHWPDPDPRMQGLDGFFAARLERA
jgi:16S rRNA (cytosine967-C5)-methyltransferase